MKSSFTNRQTILVDIARVLKFLESYGTRQTKLWKVLTKYDTLPDHFHDLQTTLQTEFDLLKKATLKNIKQLQGTINLQQTYTTSLCSHINTIHTKLVQLEKRIQTHCLYPHSQIDAVQIDAPEYDSDFTDRLIYSHRPHHMLRPHKQKQPLSPVTPKKAPSFYRIPIGLNFSLN